MKKLTNSILYLLDLDGGRARNAGDVRRERSATEDRKAKIAQYAANARARENTLDPSAQTRMVTRKPEQE